MQQCLSMGNHSDRLSPPESGLGVTIFLGVLMEGGIGRVTYLI